MRYHAEWDKYLDSSSQESSSWCVADLHKDKIIVSGVSQSTAKFVALVLNLRGKEEKKDAY